MNKVTTVNLNGTAYQLEESGYEALQDYLNSAAATLAGNPDREEIINDIEQAIGEKFRCLLSAHKNVITSKEVDAVIREMGPVEGSVAEGAGAGAASQASAAGATGAAGNAEAGAPGAQAAGAKRVHRLYRLNEGAMFSGVCSGLAVFTGVPVIAIRYLFIMLTVLSLGLGVLIYVGMAIIVPEADSPAERAAAQGPTPTAQDFIRRAREGYYEATKGFPDKQARREWKKKFRQEMRDWKHDFRWEMRANSAQWQQNWARYWERTPLGGWPLGLLWVLCSVILFGACLCGVILLVATGTVFGFALPAGMPLWVAIVLMVLFFQMLSLPLQAMRYASCGLGQRRCHCGGGFFTVFLLFVALSWWIYPEQTKAVIKEIPPTVQHAVDTVKDWWAER